MRTRLFISKNNKDWNGKTFKNVYTINESSSRSSSSSQKETDEAMQVNDMSSNYEGLKSEDFLGTFVDRKCSKCGHDGMTFSTRLALALLFAIMGWNKKTRRLKLIYFFDRVGKSDRPSTLNVTGSNFRQA